MSSLPRLHLKTEDVSQPSLLQRVSSWLSGVQFPWRRHYSPEKEAMEYNDMADKYFATGEHEQALEMYKHSLPLIRSVGDRNREATILSNMGLIYDRLGKKADALENYKQALPLLQETGILFTISALPYKGHIPIFYQFRYHAAHIFNTYTKGCQFFINLISFGDKFAGNRTASCFLELN